jgi:hypothetical protein
VTQPRKKMLEELPLSICRFWILFGIEPGARTSIQAHVPSSFSHEGAVTARTPFLRAIWGVSLEQLLA